VLNVLMLHGILYKQAFNGPAWSISVEFAAYIVFPLIAVILLWFRTPRSAYAAAGMVLVSGTAVLLAIGHWVNPSSTGQGMFWARIITEFLAGALLWKGWSMMKQPFGRWGDALVWSTVVATLVFLYFVDAQTTKVPEVFAATPLMALYVLGCAAAVGSAQRVLGSRQAVWAGRVSYSLYLTHFLVLVPVGKVIEPQDLRSAPLVLRCGWILLWLCLCYVAAYLTYTYLEEPARAWMRRRFLKEAPPVEAPDAATGDIPGP
jgi:peptidoglycan/LPS O-acetylase OafA/YrhL